jgi:hypothetical protein
LEAHVTNPWLKKNPFMSMWLSTFNTAANSLRGHAVSRIKRQAAATATRGTKSLFKAWPDVPAKPRPRKRSKKR